MGLNSSRSSPTSEQVCKKGGGGGGGGGGEVDSDGSIPVNRMMIFDHSPKGLDFKVYPGLRKHCLYSNRSSSFLVPSNLPAYQAVVIQLLSIG